MRILHIDTGSEMRGGQHQVKLLLNGLRQQGHDSILLARSSGLLARWASAAGFPVYPAKLLETWQRSRNMDVVHAHDGRAHTLAAIGSQSKFVVSRRVSFPLRRSLLSRIKYGRAARYLAVSRFVAAELQRGDVSEDKIDIVYDATEPGIATTSWQRKGPAVAPCFRNEPGKLSKLTEEACVLAGIELVFATRLVEQLRESSMFVYLTQSEGLGSAALLAMAAGVPVIASRVQGLAEVFEHDVSGLYVDNQPLAVATAIGRIREEEGLGERLRLAARARVDQMFSCDRMISETVQSYERALAS